MPSLANASVPCRTEDSIREDNHGAKEFQCLKWQSPNRQKNHVPSWIVQPDATDAVIMARHVFARVLVYAVTSWGIVLGAPSLQSAK
jgi:hypothetical protein